MKRRVEQVFAHLETKPDAVLLANATDPHLDQSFFHLFDVPGGLFEGSVAVAHPDGSLDVTSSPLEAETAHLAAKNDPHVRIHIVTRDEKDSLETVLRKLLPGSPTVGLNYPELTHGWYLRLEKLLPSAKFVDATAGGNGSTSILDVRFA